MPTRLREVVDEAMTPGTVITRTILGCREVGELEGGISRRGRMLTKSLVATLDAVM